MSRNKRDIYYIMPTSRRAARAARIARWFWTILVGLAVAGALGALLYFKDR